MKITQVAVKRPVTTFMFYLAVILLGIVSLRELSVDLLPNISYPKLSVITQFPGVAPQEIETLVTTRLESAVSRIPGLRKVESVSKEGFSYMTLEFAWGTDMDFAMLHTREKLDSVGHLLPEDVEESTIIPLDPQSRPIMILSISGQRSLLELKEFSEELIKPRLEQIEGIGSAEIAGGVEREIQIEIDPELLALYDLSIEQISQRISAFNRNLQGGTIRKGRFKYALRFVGEFEQVDEIGEISLKTTQERGVVRLDDVAEIKDSIKEREGITRLNGRESIGLLVRKESEANTVKVTNTAREVLAEIRENNPGVDILIVQEQAKYIENAISSVVNAIILGGILAFLVLIVFLQDVKTPVIIAVVIPISIIATFNLLFFRDITLNIMSLGGLALGVGMLVDNSIVVSESIFRHSQKGSSLALAAVTGTKEVGMAVTASTLTTISVFLPVIYVHGIAGQLFKDQALTVTFALISSLIVSLTLLPMLTSRHFDISGLGAAPDAAPPGKKERESGYRPGSKWRILGLPFRGIRWILKRVVGAAAFGLNLIISLLSQLALLIVHYLSLPVRPVFGVIFAAYNKAYAWFERRYHEFLLWALDHKGRVFASAAAFLALTLFVGSRLPRELMPKPEAVSFEVQMKTPIDYSLEQTAEVVASLEQWLSRDKRVKATFSQIGVVSGMESLNPDISLNSAKLYVEAHDKNGVEPTIESIRERLAKFPGLGFSIVREQSTLAQFLAFSAAEVGLKIKGDDLDTLKALAEDLVARLQTVPGITDVNTNIGEGKPEFLIRMKPQALEKYDIAPSDIGNFLINAVRGRRDTQFKELEKKYDILVRLEEQTRDNIDSLLDEQLPVKGTLIPLRELVSYEIATGPKEIRRENQQREVVVTANLKGTKISQAAPLIQEKIDELSLPSDYRVAFSGEQEEMTKSFQSLVFAFGLAVLLVYMIMAAQFESLIHPFLILFTLPMGLTGAVWALVLTGQTLNVISVIGMVVLAGIVVNDAIVKIDYTNQMRKQGMGVRDSIMEASRVRLRPILMTTVTTVLGLFPMSLGLGKGSELQQPLAISVVGGLLLATFLTLILIPMAYDMAGRKKQ